MNRKAQFEGLYVKAVPLSWVYMQKSAGVYLSERTGCRCDSAFIKEDRHISLARDLKKRRWLKRRKVMKVFFPKNVKFPRPKLRYMTDKMGITITRNPEKADAIAVDFIMLHMMPRYGNGKLRDKVFALQNNNDNRIVYMSPRGKDLAMSDPQIAREWTMVGSYYGVNDKYKVHLETLDHVIQLTEQYPHKPVVSVDWLNAQVNQDNLDSMEDFLQIVRLLLLAEDAGTANMVMGFMQNLNPKINFLPAWILAQLAYDVKKSRLLGEGNRGIHSPIAKAMNRTANYMCTTRFLRRARAMYYRSTDLPSTTSLHRIEPERIVAYYMYMFLDNATKESKILPVPLWMAKWFLKRNLEQFSPQQYAYMEVEKEPYFIQELTGMAFTDLSDKRIDYFSRSLGINLRTLANFLVKNYEQTEQNGRPQLGENVYQQAQKDLSLCKKQPK